MDQRSFFNPATSTFHSKRPPISLPPNYSLDITTFISSQPHSSTTAFIDATTDRRLSYFDLWTAVHSLSYSLSTSYGIEKGNVVLILSPNSLHFPIVCLSVMSLGALVTTANPLNTPEELARQRADSKPVLAFTTRQLAHKLSGSGLPLILMGSYATVGDLKADVRVVSTMEELLKEDSAGKVVKKEQVCQSDAAALLYSSGTTGVSKGVITSHRNLIAMAQMLCSRYNFSQAKGSLATFVSTIPMFHIYGYVFTIGFLAFGATFVVLSKFEIDDVLQAISTYKVNYFPLVPPILVSMVKQADQLKKKYDLSSLIHVSSGGAPLGKETIEGFTAKFPSVSIMQGYGLTESTGFAASTNGVEESRKYGTAGLLAPCIEAKIVCPETRAHLGVNQAGELWLRGPAIMKGYLNNPDATASTLSHDGWLKTGDICYIDEYGYLYVVDRLKELIKYKGYQVAPAELEALLLTHPDIIDTAVIPFPDEEVGQYPMAFVVKKADSTLSETAVMEFTAKQIAPYKKIRKVAFVSSIAKNASGKILRKDLIKMASYGSKL